jgi:hypothetical protein
MNKLACLTAGFLLVPCLPVFAHHSFAAEFDASKKVEFKGTVTKVEWMNPHVSGSADDGGPGSRNTTGSQ